jgi:hypothetical protein
VNVKIIINHNLYFLAPINLLVSEVRGAVLSFLDVVGVAALS